MASPLPDVNSGFLGFVKNNVIGLIIGATVTFLVMLLFTKDKISALKITGGDGPFSIELSNDNEIQYSALLDSLWKDNFTRAGLIDYFNKKGFVRKSDQKLVDVLKSITYNDPLANDIREMANNKLGPWKKIIQADSGVISIPAYDVEQGFAYAFNGSDYNGQLVSFSDPEGNQLPIQLEVVEKRGDTPDKHKLKEFHVNRSDFQKLIKKDVTISEVFISPIDH